MNVLTIHIAADAVASLGVAGRPLSPKALVALLALTDAAPNGAKDTNRSLSLAWLSQRCGTVGKPVQERVLRRVLADLHHAGLITLDAKRGRAPFVRVEPAGTPFTAVPVALLWSTNATVGGPLRDGALQSVVALLTLLQGCDWRTRKGRAALADLSERRNKYTELRSIEEVKPSRVALQRLAGPSMTWARPANGKGRGYYHVTYDWGLLPPLSKADGRAIPDSPPVPTPPRDAPSQSQKRPNSIFDALRASASPPLTQPAHFSTDQETA
jgi:hypothetical protein